MSSAAAAGTDDLALALVGQVAEKLELDHRSVDGPPPSPPVLGGIWLELDASQGPLDASRVSVGLDVGDEQDVDVGRPEMLGNERIVAGQDVWDQAAEDDQEHVLVTELVDEPQ